MNNSLKLLLEQVYELEGLLLVADNHGSEINEYVFDLIHKKAGSIAELSKWVNADAFADDKPVESAKPDEAEVEKPAETVEPAPAEKEITASIDEYKDESYDDLAQEPSRNDADEEEYEEADEAEEAADEDDDEPLTVDEVLRRKRSSDLHKAFSLNDRFRYRRELFANNDVEMNDTLNLVETMHTFAEAEDFFYGDLEWDKESPEVIDFMAVIRNYFYNRNDA